MRVLFRCVFWLLTAACAVVLGAVGYMQQTLPDRYTVGCGQEVQVGKWVQSRTPLQGENTVRASAVPAGGEYRTCLTLGGWFPVKDVTVAVTEDKVVMVCGTPFGIKLYTKGVLVVGLSDVDTAAGKVNPAAAAGVCIGDAILAVNGRAVATSNEVGALIRDCGGKKVTLRLERDGVEFEASFTPVKVAGEEGYRAGLWVRDSAAGIGTLTFYNPADGTFGGGILNGGEGIRIIPEGYPAMQMVMPVGGFLTLGFVIAGYQWLTRRARNKKKKEAVKK